MSELSITVTRSRVGDGICTVLQLWGEADVTTPELTQVLTSETALRPWLLLLDLSTLRFMDSSALSAIMHAHEQVTQNGGRLALVRPGRTVARVMKLTGVDRLVSAYPTIDDAVMAEQSAGQK